MGFNTSNNELKRDRRAPMIGASEREREGDRGRERSQDQCACDFHALCCDRTVGATAMQILILGSQHDIGHR